MLTITLDQIKEILPTLDLMPAIEEGFVAYSEGRTEVPPVGELVLDKGEVHIKYGYIRGEEYYVIKIASGFYDNAALGVPSGNGLMMVFRQETGMLECILLEECHLTDARTAIAGAIAARHLAPSVVERIGIVGTGVQARLQLRHLAPIVDCRRVLVWGRVNSQLSRYRDEMAAEGFEIETTLEAGDILKTCNLVVTTTPATHPLLEASDVRPGTHITAMGSDTPDKQELEAGILAGADVLVADSISQCFIRGEIHQAQKAGRINRNDVVELGNVISGNVDGRTSDDQVTVVDLTGVAVQDIKIAVAVYETALKQR